MRSAMISILGAALVFGSIPACDSAVDSAVPDPGTGTIVQNWTIEGTTQLQKCTSFGATQMRVVMFDAAQTVYATQIAPCEAFTLTRVVRAQPYTAIATFFDASGNPVSETRSFGDFEVFTNATTQLVIDFPTASLGAGQ